MKPISKIIIVVAVLAIVAYVFLAFDISRAPKATDFASCVAAGNAVMESYPRQCADKEGNTYTEVIHVNASSTDDMTAVTVTSPKSGASIASPAIIEGSAPGNWFFEATLPVQLLSADGKVLGQAPATALDDWMSTGTVRFKATVPFEKGSAKAGVIRIAKDNPSGLPEHDAHIDFPVTFGTAATTTVSACVIGGCSSEICSDQPMMSSCIYREQFACYKGAECKRQPTGQCGWTQTTALAQCLSSHS